MSNAPRDRRGKRYWGDDDSQTNILHIDMDSFFAQVEIREDPSLAGKAVIVGGTSNRGVVTSATYEARALGVRAGMPTARARALCPTAVFVPGHFELYREYSKRVMSVIARFSPLVEQVSVDEAFVDVRGCVSGSRCILPWRFDARFERKLAFLLPLGLRRQNRWQKLLPQMRNQMVCF